MTKQTTSGVSPRESIAQFLARRSGASSASECGRADDGDSWLIKSGANPREWMVADAEDSVNLGDTL
jgi:hypothetical protein